MNTQEVRAEWVKRLRSGKYMQGTGALRRTPVLSEQDKFCCLGVLCEIAVEQGVIPPPARNGAAGSWNYGPSDAIPAYVTMPPPKVLQWAGLGQMSANLLASLNDKGETFGEIAKRIEFGVLR